MFEQLKTMSNNASSLGEYLKYSGYGIPPWTSVAVFEVKIKWGKI
jgi:hypothetical protein